MEYGNWIIGRKISTDGLLVVDPRYAGVKHPPNKNMGVVRSFMHPILENNQLALSVRYNSEILFPDIRGLIFWFWPVCSYGWFFISESSPSRQASNGTGTRLPSGCIRQPTGLPKSTFSRDTVDRIIIRYNRLFKRKYKVLNCLHLRTSGTWRRWTRGSFGKVFKGNPAEPSIHIHWFGPTRSWFFLSTTISSGA
jgi:hypothetical protein